METQDLPSGRRSSGALLFVASCAVVFALAWIIAPRTSVDLARFSDATLMLVGVATGAVMFIRALRPDAWEGILFYAVAMFVLAISKVIDLVGDMRQPHLGTTRSTDLAFLLIGALFLFPARIQFRDHFNKEDRREISADVALIAAALITTVYLFLRPDGPTQQAAALAWSAIFAATAAAAITAFIALALWHPTARHVGQLVVVAIFAGATLTVGSFWIGGESAWGTPALDVPIGLGAFLLAAMTVWPGKETEVQRRISAGWGRPVLTASSIVAGSVSLGTIAAREARGSASIPEGSILIILMATAVAARILVNQVRSRRATHAAHAALQEKDVALADADEAMRRLTDAIETVAASEDRLRLLFDAAVDGIVEIDGRGVIRRANEAFGQMVGLDRDFIVGGSWDGVCGAVRGAGSSLMTLPETGQATIAKEGHETFLEARASAVPGSPPGRLLLVRDVTAAKVADQTIRSLFKFLQDRDEDRTRLLKRTNAAIESERNRIARDLHDGPVQGVSAASLSIEAVMLMIKGGDYGAAADTLVKIRGQLSEEADNLRRLMSNLRPPILEERGLVPALQETLSRFGTEEGMVTHFRSRSLVELPSDLETLAYRLVQEALSNARKHSQAAEVTLTVDAVAGQLRVEVVDDGIGFDPSKARDFLRAGKVGLASMRERIELANGTFMVRSGLENGTTIVATLPLDTVPAAQSV